MVETARGNNMVIPDWQWKIILLDYKIHKQRSARHHFELCCMCLDLLLRMSYATTYNKQLLVVSNNNDEQQILI
jgi:hypothetical protein